MSDFATPVLIAIFVVAAGVTWFAGVNLGRSTDALDARYDLGDAIGGLILLAISGSLPEAAITVSAIAAGSPDLAAGNLVGGIAAQTMVLVLCDRAVRGDRPLTFLAASLLPVIEGGFVVAVVALALMGTMLPGSLAFAGISPSSASIVVVWIVSIVVVDRVRRKEPWTIKMPGGRSGRRHIREPHPDPKVDRPFAARSNRAVLAIFAAASLATLVAGVALAFSSSALADRFGINGVVFGATLLAFVTALPEISSGIEAVRLGDNQLAIGDIFGGNAFQLTLLALADFLAGSPILPKAAAENAWLAALGILLTVIYMIALVVRPQRRILGFGPESLVAIGVFVLGIWGLTALAGGS